MLPLSLALETTLDDLYLPNVNGQYVVLAGGQLLGLPATRHLPYPPGWASAWDGDESKLSTEPIRNGEEG